jgi:hypothetical protein
MDDFDAWWREKYFHTSNPLYLPFKKISGLGVNLDYVDYLLELLKLNDNLIEFAKSPEVQPHWKKMVQPAVEFQNFLCEAPMYHLYASAGAFGMLTEIKKEYFSQAQSPWEILPKEKMRKVVMDILRSTLPARPSNSPRKPLNIIHLLLDRYAAWHTLIKPWRREGESFWKPGRPDDSWANFILVAMTTHFERVTQARAMPIR